MEEWERALEAQKHERAQIEEMRRRLEAYCLEKTGLPVELAAPCIALARIGLTCIDEESARGKLEAVTLQYVKRVVEPILDVLHRTESQETTASVNDLVALCLRLTEVKDIRVKYTGEAGFPLDILIDLAGVDRTATVERLCETVRDRGANPQACLASIVALARIGDKRAVEPLVGLLNKEADVWGEAATAACALVDLGDEEAVMPIVSAMERHFYSGNFEDWTSREYIAQRMGRLVRPGTDLYQEVRKAWRAAREPSTGATPEVRITQKRALALALEQVLVDSGGPEAVEIAKGWSQAARDEVALKGTRALAGLDCEEATDALCSILANPRQFIVGYHDQGDSWDIPDEGPNTEQRILAAKGLAERGGPRALAALKKAASDEDAEVREAVKQLLSSL